MDGFLDFLKSIFIISVWILTAVLVGTEVTGIMAVITLTLSSLNLLYLLWLIPLTIITSITVYFGFWASENMA